MKSLARLWRTSDEALAELAGRYFASRGPATVADFAWWAGVTTTEGIKVYDNGTPHTAILMGGGGYRGARFQAVRHGIRREVFARRAPGVPDPW